MRLSLAWLALLWAAWLSAAAPISDDDLDLRQLTEDNFRASTSRGLWLVEHFSPRCGHCRHFAPTWKRLAEKHKQLERLSGFYMAQVNCMAQGDLCNRNEIKFYPQLVLYADGSPKATYSGDRSFDDLSKFIHDHSTEYAHQQLDGSDEGPYVSQINPDGQVVEANEESFEAMKAAGPVLVDFYAPWCPHCKHLRPIYNEVGESLKGRLNVLAVDCEASKAFCKSIGIRGFPTIKMFNGDSETEYSGARSKDALEEFALKAAQSSAIRRIAANDFDAVVAEHDTFFLYLQNFDTAVTDVATVKATLARMTPDIPSFTSFDSELYNQLSIGNPPPTSSLLAFSSHSKSPLGSLAFPTSPQALEKFINIHRFPTLVELTTTNYNDMMKSASRSVVVFAALHSGEEGAAEQAALYEIARTWKRGGRRFNEPLSFAWVEAEKWTKWLQKTYGVKKDDLPALIVVDTSTSEYYDSLSEGSKITLDGPEVFSALEGVYQHSLTPKTAHPPFEWGSHGATMTLISLSRMGTEYPFMALLCMVGGVGTLIILLQRCMRDPRELRDRAGRLD